MKVIILIAILVAGGFAMDWNTVYQYVQERTVIIQFTNNDNIIHLGSGVIVAPELVLTCTHCVKNRRVHDKEVVVFKNQDYGFVILDTLKGKDLALLRVNGLQTTTNKLIIGQSQNGEHVMVYGLAGFYGWCQLYGHTANLDSGFVMVDRSIFKGMSGGGVWNNRGQLVGICQMIVTDYGMVTLAKQTYPLLNWIVKYVGGH